MLQNADANPKRILPTEPRIPANEVESGEITQLSFPIFLKVLGAVEKSGIPLLWRGGRRNRTAD